MEFHLKTKYSDERVVLSFEHYGDHSTAIRLVSLDYEPIAVATVALDEKPPAGHVFLKGWSENEGIPDALVKAGIVELTGRTIPTGYCEAQEAKLLIELPAH